MIFLTLKTEQTIAVVKGLSRWFPEKIVYRIGNVLRTFIDGLLVIHNRERYLLVAVLSIAMWILYAIQFYVVFFGFEATSQLTLFDATILMVIASIGIIIPMPGGTGSFHLFCSQALILLFQIPSDQALSYATVTHGVGFIFLLTAGALVLILTNIKISETTAVINER
jgi:uncharacterized protein (TIRG00374 family)